MIPAVSELRHRKALDLPLRFDAEVGEDVTQQTLQASVNKHGPGKTDARC